MLHPFFVLYEEFLIKYIKQKTEYAHAYPVSIIIQI